MQSTHPFPRLQPGDQVEIIAPASRFSDAQLLALHAILESWQLQCIIQDDIFGSDLLCAHSDTKRFEHLQKALCNPDTKAIFCGRGGYGSMRLIPALKACAPPKDCKLLIGMSDITALHLFLQQTWKWPTIHASTNTENLSPESWQALHTILFESQSSLGSPVLPMNKAAETCAMVQSTITGGNLTLVQSSIGTSWQMDARDKIILLEEINERAYKIDRILEQIKQASLFNEAKAILLGDFLGGNEPDGSCLIQPVLQHFADQTDIPVFKTIGVGHGSTNFPLVLGMPATLDVHQKKLTIELQGSSAL